MNFKAEIERRWVFWLLDIGVAVLCILVSLQIAHQYLIARPLRCLMEGIRHMEMGYWGGLKIPKGAWEMRWLAYRFQKLGTKLEETVQHLVEAERRALLHSHASPDRLEKRVTKNITNPDDVLAFPEALIFSGKNLFPQGIRRHDLLDKCCFLESQRTISQHQKSTGTKASIRVLEVSTTLSSKSKSAQQRCTDRRREELQPIGNTRQNNRAGWIPPRSLVEDGGV